MPLEQDEILILLLRGRAMLLAYIHAIVRDPHLAEDVFQEVSIISVKKRDTIQDEVHFQAWVRRTARLEAMNALRRQKKSPEPLCEGVLDLLDSHWDNQDDDRAAPRVEALRCCLQKLTPRAQRLVRLRYGEGISSQRLAETQGVAANTVYVALARIHRTLGECIRRRLASEGVAGV